METMKHTHYFFALALPNHVKQELRNVSEQIASKHAFKKWVHYEDYHITLAFLGNTNPNQLKESIRNVKSSLEGSLSFMLHMNQVGIFGRSDAPRILWAGVEHSTNLVEVQKLVYDSCTKAGFHLDKRPFNPHITLARKWAQERPFMMSELLIEMEQYFSGIDFFCREVVLYQTHLERTPKYEKIESFKLQKM